MEKLIEKLKRSGVVGFFLAMYIVKIYNSFKNFMFDDEYYLKKKFYKAQGYRLNLKNPRSLNEKIQWLKLNDRRDLNTKLADKFAVRDYIIECFGEHFLVPLLYHTANVQDLNPEQLPNAPFIIKSNHDSGNYVIVRDKNQVDWGKIRLKFKWCLAFNYYYVDREWQYKNIKPIIMIEQLLVQDNGRIPNDYKLHCINGKVAFVYVSVDREGENKRNIYDIDWNPLNFTFARKGKSLENILGNDIEPPLSFPQMIEFAEKIARLYTYIRVDFYDVDGRLYFGEITHHHGGGFDQIRPIEWDYEWGKMLNLNLHS
jgi:hypothetical protein